MPTYAYRCTACEHAFEVQQSFTDDALSVCPECEGRLRKVFSAVGVVFKGSGFYRNDARAGSSTSAGRSSTSATSTGGSTTETPTAPSTSTTPSTAASSGTSGSSSAGSTGSSTSSTTPAAASA